MDDEIIKDIFGWTGTGLAIYFFISPVVPFCKLINEQMKINEIPGILLFCSFMNCILWADYGLIHDRFLQYFPNGLGGSITLVFITIFLIFLAEKRLSFVLLYLGCLGIAILGISFLFYRIVRVDITGIVANIFNVLMYAAPGEKIYTVFKTGNYELIPIWSTFGACACSASWLIYGIYLPDWLVIIPNLLGVICAILEIIIYYIFKGKAKKNDVDGGLTQEE